jgi:hypothetical protein
LNSALPVPEFARRNLRALAIARAGGIGRTIAESLAASDATAHAA